MSSASSKKQPKLAFFLKKMNQNGQSTSIGQTERVQRKYAQLQQEIRLRDQIIQKIKKQREDNALKYRQLSINFQQQKRKNMLILQGKLRESSEYARKIKAEINPQLGYFTQRQKNYTQFIEGEYITKTKRRIEAIDKQILELEQKKRNSKSEDKQRVAFQIEFLRKEKNDFTEILKNKNVELTLYKEKLKLADKEMKCTFQKSGWPLITQRYLPLELLGSGGFGQVYKCYDLKQNNQVALKTNCFEPTNHQDGRAQFLKHVVRQVQTLKSLNHPNIAKLFEEVELGDNKLSFIMQYCSGPQLSKYLLKNGHLQQRQAKGIIRQLSFALKYMSEHKVIHYDLKPSNIIFHNGTVKILDFGLCKKIQTEDTKIDLTSQGVGTMWYLPPETFGINPQISNKVDVWSLGVIFYQLIYGRRPFGHGISQTKIYNQGIILKALKVQFPVDKKFRLSQEAKKFIIECLKYDVKERLDPNELYQHPYLTR